MRIIVRQGFTWLICKQLGQGAHRLYQINPKDAKCTAGLAPGGKGPDATPVLHVQGPDDAIRQGAIQAAILHRELLA